MADTHPDGDLAQEVNTLIDTSKSTSEAFTIIGTELIEVKAVRMTLIDLQKAVLFASGSPESELETNVQNLLDGYRKRFLSQMAGRIKEAAQAQTRSGACACARPRRGVQLGGIMKRVAILALMIACLQSSCIMVGGYSNRGGWFFWPGGLGILLLIVVVLLLARRRRR